MKAISVRQPFAAFLAAGEKTVELRSWATPHRGELAICASASDDDVWFGGEPPVLLPAGAVVGVVNLIDCRPATADDAEAAMCDVPPNSFAWVVEPLYLTRPDKVVGKLRLFDVADDLIVRLEGDDWWGNYPPPQGAKKPGKKSWVLPLNGGQ